MSRRILLLAAMLLLFLMPALAEDGANLLVNGGFESLDADGLPTGWYTDAYVTREGVTLYSVTEEARSGSRAAVVENVGSNDARFAQRVRVEPNSLYRLSGWIRTDQMSDNGRGANLSVADLYYAVTSSVFDSKGEWVYVEMYGETGPGQTEVTVFARVGGYSGESSGWAAFDDLSLTKVGALPDGATACIWYRVDPVVIEDAGIDDTEESEPAAFWPWLIVISGVYGAFALWACRWISLRGAADALRPSGRKASSGRGAMLLCGGLTLAALVRIVIAALVEGYQVDVGCFSSWGYSMLTRGPERFYGLEGDYMLHDQTGANFCDYPPAYLYVMGLNAAIQSSFGAWASGVGQALAASALPGTGLLSSLFFGMGTAAFAHKLVPMTCDILAAMLINRCARDGGCSRKQAGLAALLFAFNPAVILNSAGWCQIDSVLSLSLMLVAYLAYRRRWALALPVYVVSALIKPQALMLGFLGLAAIVLELMRDKPGRDDLGRLRFPKVWRDMGLGVLLSAAAAAVIVIPFSFHQGSPFWLVSLYGDTLASYPYATVNTANLYYLFGGNWSTIVQDADAGVTLTLLLLSLLWGAVTFLRRRDRTLSFIEPAVCLLLAAGLALCALGLMPMLSGESEPYLLTTGGQWFVYTVDGEYVREHLAADAAGLLTLTIPVEPVLLLLLGAGALGVAGAMMYLLMKRIGMGVRDRLHTGLIEPALAALFALVYAGMLIFDTTWGALGTAAMAMAFAVVLPMYLRSGELKHLPLCGAVLFILLYVCGVKMHERYLFPALFLLGMACAMQRDRRLVLLLAGLSVTLFINEGVVLDNSLRLGSLYGHLNAEDKTLAMFISAGNVGLAVWSAWLCQRLCAEKAEPSLSGSADTPILPVRSYEAPPCTPLNAGAAPRVKWTLRDALLVLIVTLVYSVVTFTTLGSTKAPQNPWKSTNAQEQVVIDLGAYYENFSMLYFCQVSYDDFSIAVSPDGQTWPEEQVYWAEMAEGQCFRWKYMTPSYLSDGDRKFYGGSDFASVQKMSGRYVCLTAQQVGLVVNEVIFRDAQGGRIDAQIVRAINANEASPLLSAPENLLDEQDTLIGEPGWWNSTYFDEIYHARTAFEHLNGTMPYETSHPPLGKVIMSWCVALLGMTPFGWRFAGALCGVMMLPVMYALAKQLTRRWEMGFAAMTLMALDCMHFTQTRIATIDSFPVLFILLSYFFMLRFMQRDIVRDDVKTLLPDLALSGFFMGCGVASKWIGVYAGVGLAVLYFWTCLRQLRIGMDSARMKRSGAAFSGQQLETLEARDLPAMRRVITLCLWCLLFFVAVPAAIYLLSYIPYYAYRKVTSLGEYLRLVIQSQEGMLNYHATPGLGMDHPFYSPWYEWPVMKRPMYYASPAFVPQGWSYAIFCFGNQAVWYAGLAGIAYTVYRWAQQHRYRIDGHTGTWHLCADTWDVTPAFVLVGLLAQFLPWVLVPRGTYIYHYFASVPFLILGTVLLLERVFRRSERMGRWVMTVYLLVCLAFFVLLFPHASGVLAPEAWLDFVEESAFLPHVYH